jgi:RNA:NAD 2'-phosphotransferase (TPT1/KptA family)
MSKHTDELVITLVDAEQLKAKGHDIYELDEQDYEIFALTETVAGEILLVEGVQERQS